MKLFSKSILFCFFVMSAILFNACLDDCELIDCQNGGTCDLGFCDCPAGFDGDFCETELTGLCATVDCNNGSCDPDTGLCDCDDGFTGANCETEADPCLGVECQNGNCDTNGDCICETGYEGTFCETESRAKFIGVYTISEDCQGVPFSYDLIITEGSGNDVSLITLTNFAESYTIEATVTADEFVITNAESNGNTFNGMGSLNGNTIDYSFTAAGTYDLNCTATGTK